MRVTGRKEEEEEDVSERASKQASSKLIYNKLRNTTPGRQVGRLLFAANFSFLLDPSNCTSHTDPTSPNTLK